MLKKIRSRINRHKYRYELYRFYNLFFQEFKVDTRLIALPYPNLYSDTVIMFKLCNLEDERLELSVTMKMDRFYDKYPRVRICTDFFFDGHIAVDYMDRAVKKFTVKSTDEEILSHFYKVRSDFNAARADLAIDQWKEI